MFDITLSKLLFFLRYFFKEDIFSKKKPHSFNLFFIRIIRRTFQAINNMANYFLLNVFKPFWKILVGNSFHLYREENPS